MPVGLVEVSWGQSAKQIKVNKLAQVANPSLSLLLIGSPPSMLAQSLESLEREGLITPNIRKFLEERKAFTPKKREEVITKACNGGGGLSAKECSSLGCKRRRNHPYWKPEYRPIKIVKEITS